MKMVTTLGIALAAAAFIFVGCSDQNAAAPAEKAQKHVEPTISEESLGLRKTGIYGEQSTMPDKTQYGTSMAGSGHKIKRAFQDAPPMIPHDTEGMLPITINNNACIGCHMPDVAAAMGATPVPESHFLDMRPKHNYDGKIFSKAIDNMKNETSVKKIDHLSGARFNCSQCHAPQSQGDLAVPNTFEPIYTAKDGAEKSSWKGTNLYEGLDTLKEH